MKELHRCPPSLLFPPPPPSLTLSPYPLAYLGPDEEIEVPDALVLSHQSGGQPQLTVAVHDADHLTGGGGGGGGRESRWALGSIVAEE